MTGNLTEKGEEYDNSRDSGVGGRHNGVSVVVGGSFERGWCHTTFRSQWLGI